MAVHQRRHVVPTISAEEQDKEQSQQQPAVRPQVERVWARREVGNQAAQTEKQRDQGDVHLKVVEPALVDIACLQANVHRLW